MVLNVDEVQVPKNFRLVFGKKTLVLVESFVEIVLELSTLDSLAELSKCDGGHILS